jgi:hypothetical protein
MNVLFLIRRALARLRELPPGQPVIDAALAFSEILGSIVFGQVEF